MDTTRKIIDILTIELNGYKLSDESKVPDNDYLLDKLNHYRAVSLRDLKVIPESMYTETTCNEIKCEGSSCVINGKTYTSPFLLHYVDVEPLFDNVGWANIRYLGLDGYQYNFIRKNLDSFMNNDSEFSLTNPYYAVVGNRILIKGLDGLDLKLLTISALFNNPVIQCGHGWDMPYPCPDDILARAVYLVKKDVIYSMGINTEILNNTNTPDVQQQPQNEQQE